MLHYNLNVLLQEVMMRKVDLRMNEDKKYRIIKKLVESNGNKKKAAMKLNCSTRTINRLIFKYKEMGKEGFVHGNRNRLPASTISSAQKDFVKKIYVAEYSDANFSHFTEILNEDFGISVSDTTIHKWLREENVLSPKAHKKTRKIMKKILKAEQKSTSSQKVQNEIKLAIATIDDNCAHPRRPRSKYFGEMIQMDASSFEWISGQIWHLHLAIDDASGEVVGAYFDFQETLKGYYNVLYHILINYGIPAMFYTDRRTVFEYKRKNNALDDEDTFTQFSYACHNLGIEIKTTSIAQAKGRIERLNQTFQSRLPVELRRARITSIEDANEFLKSYLKKFNGQFALCLNTTKSVFEKQPTLEEINCTLAVLSPRKIDSGHSIRYNNKIYLPESEKGIPCYFKNKSDCIVIEAFDNNLYVNVLDNIYIMKEVPQHEVHSKEFDGEIEKPKQKKKYIPPMNHPWRIDNILQYHAKQKHQYYGANV